MKTKVNFIYLVALLMLLCACSAEQINTEQPHTAAPPQTSEQTGVDPSPSGLQATPVETTPSPSPPDSGIVVGSGINLVDERFELVSVIFRLAGNPEYSDENTAYQREVRSAFYEFRSHPAVTYTTQNLQFGYSDVFNMAIHMEKAGDSFHLVENHDFLIEQQGGYTSWTETKAARFVELLNDFYADTNFAEFFKKNTELYEEHSKRFEDDVLSQIDFEWFRQYGIDPDNMKTVLSPSSSRANYGGWVYGDTPKDTLVYAALSVTDSFAGALSIVIHEFSHAIGNPLADVWYNENPAFRHWSFTSVDIERYPFYPNGRIMAREYVTRAYVILYLAENTETDLMQLFLNEIGMGFPYIQNVYAMITDHEIVEYVGDIGAILGIDDYIIGDERSVRIDGHIIKWYFIDLLGHELSLEDFTSSQVGNAFGSQTGDVLYVIVDGSDFLFIDLGSARDHGWSAQHRLYCVFPLDKQ